MKRVVIAAAVIAVATAACGGGGKDHPAMDMKSSGTTATDSTSAGKAVDIDMVDIGYQPTTLTAKPGERVEFVFHNRGKTPHDAFIGDASAQADHEREMRQAEGGSGGGGHKMGDMNAITVEPGKIGNLTYTFDKAGTVEIGCHQPGHYAAGMKIAVTAA